MRDPVGKIAKKQSVVFFDNTALYFECRINKKGQTAFLAILVDRYVVFILL